MFLLAVTTSAQLVKPRIYIPLADESLTESTISNIVSKIVLKYFYPSSTISITSPKSFFDYQNNHSDRNSEQIISAVLRRTNYNISYQFVTGKSKRVALHTSLNLIVLDFCQEFR